MKPFNLEAAKSGEAIVTRDGKSAIFMCHNARFEPSRRVWAMVGTDANAYFESGRMFTSMESPEDLFMAPKKREAWVNVYDIGAGDGMPYVGVYVFKTKEEGAKATENTSRYIATAKIEWEE